MTDTTLWYAFVLGPLAVTVRYWEEHDVEDEGEVEAGARVELRRVDETVGRAHRPGAEGFTVQPVSHGGLWRADLFTRIQPPDDEPRFHHHPSFRDDDVGTRDFDPEIAEDPVGWTLTQLRDLPRLLDRAGAGDLADQVDRRHLEQVLPAVRAAIDTCLASRPTQPG